MQEWAIQHESNTGYSIKIGQYGCEEISKWKIVRNPNDIKKEDIFHCHFFIWCQCNQHKVFKISTITLEHGDEERQINHALCEGCAFGLDGNTKDLEARWLKEDELEGIVEGLNATIVVVWFVTHALRGRWGNALTIACDGHCCTSMALSFLQCAHNVFIWLPLGCT